MTPEQEVVQVRAAIGLASTANSVEVVRKTGDFYLVWKVTCWELGLDPVTASSDEVIATLKSTLGNNDGDTCPSGVDYHDFLADHEHGS